MRAPALLAAAVLLGCSATSSDSDPIGSTGRGSSSGSADPSGETSSEPAETSSTADSSSTSEEDPASSSDTTASIGDGSTGPAPADDRLFPIEVGRVWTYEVTPSGAVPTCGGGTFTEEVLGTVDIGGEQAFEMTSFCTAVDSSVFRIDGDLVDLDNGGTWIRVLDEPVEDGHEWNSTGPINYTWRSEGSVTVPAGTYEPCWTRVQLVSYTAETTFCRGVGMVRSVSSDLSGGGWDAVLTAATL